MSMNTHNNFPAATPELKAGAQERWAVINNAVALLEQVVKGSDGAASSVLTSAGMPASPEAAQPYPGLAVTEPEYEDA